MPVSRNLLRTSTFRLSAVYLLVFALSVGAILGYVYINTVVLLEQQTEDTIEEVFEPHLLRCGFLQKTARGRVITRAGRRALGLPDEAARDGDLYD